MSPVAGPWPNTWEMPGQRQRSFWERLTPAQLFVGSFLLLIGLGTLGLKTLPGLYTGEPLGGWTHCLLPRVPYA